MAGTRKNPGETRGRKGPRAVNNGDTIPPWYTHLFHPSMGASKSDHPQNPVMSCQNTTDFKKITFHQRAIPAGKDLGTAVTVYNTHLAIIIHCLIPCFLSHVYLNTDESASHAQGDSTVGMMASLKFCILQRYNSVS